MAKWLESYYTEEWRGKLNPVAFLEGKDFAVVRVGGTSYVLINKFGCHGRSKQVPLFVGIPQPEDLEKMKAALAKADR